MGCQMLFYNPEQCFGTIDQCFCSNGRYQKLGVILIIQCFLLKNIIKLAKYDMKI